MKEGKFQKELFKLKKKAHASCVKLLTKNDSKFIFSGTDNFYYANARILSIYVEENRIYGILGYNHLCDLSYSDELIYIADYLDQKVICKKNVIQQL